MPLIQFRNAQGQRVTVSPENPLPVYLPDTYVVLGNIEQIIPTTMTIPRNCFDWGVFDCSDFIEVGYLATVNSPHSITARLCFFRHDYYGDFNQEANPALYRHNVPGTAPTINNTAWTRFAVNTILGFTRCAFRLDSRTYNGGASAIPITVIIWGRY